MSTNDNPYFCVLPWIHMHIWPNGVTYPCCLSTGDYQLGNTNRSSFLELWNSDKMRLLRRNIVNKKPTNGCSRCYEHEANNAKSMRMSLNEDFLHHHDRVSLTNNDGSLDEVFMAYMDIRFSNICNFKCRSCGPELSSFWVDDGIKLNRYSPNAPKILKVKNTLDELWEDIEQWIDTVERIYFAGGEPLIMDEHYKILEYLLKIGKTDIPISYNTNLSKLTYKDKNVISLWKHFSNIRVSASLDGMGDRAEVIRKGTVWADIEQNRRILLTEFPDLNFEINPTISVYNVEHCIDFFNDWIEKEYITPLQISCNVLLFPEFLRFQILPEEDRIRIKEKYIKFVTDHNINELDKHGQVYGGFMSVISSLDDDRSDLVDEFLVYNNALDQIRQEALFETFPELKVLIK